MERRKFVLGLGSLAAGGAAAMGTGAVNFMYAPRNIGVAVADDDRAFVKLEPTSPYASLTNSGDRQLSLNFDEDAAPTGEGLNPNADSRFDEVFRVKNQSGQAFTLNIYPRQGDTSGGVNGDEAEALSVSLSEANASSYSSGGINLGTGEAADVRLTFLLRENPKSELPDYLAIYADESGSN